MECSCVGRGKLLRPIDTSTAEASAIHALKFFCCPRFAIAEDWDVVLDVEASRERTYCGAISQMREVPKTMFRPPIKPCPSKGLTQDWYSVAVLAADPAVDFEELSNRLSDQVELLGTELLPDNGRSPELEELKMKPSRVLVLSKAGDDGDENEDDMFTTLAQMASSEVIILVSNSPLWCTRNRIT